MSSPSRIAALPAKTVESASVTSGKHGRWLPLRLNNSTHEPHRAVARMPSDFGSMQYAVVSEGNGAGRS